MSEIQGKIDDAITTPLPPTSNARNSIVKKTILEMMAQRNYTVDEDESDYTDVMITATKPNSEKMCVFFVTVEKVNTDCIQTYICTMHKLKVKHAILIYNENITSSAKKNIKDVPILYTEEITHSSAMEKMNIELFSRKELIFNITKHSLQPIFRILSDTESEKFKKQFGIKHPKLLTSDPIARFYGLSPGSVVEITRKNGFVMYRIVRLKI